MGIANRMKTLYIFARFDPLPGKRDQLRRELEAVLAPTLAEEGCIRINLFESFGDPDCFYIHSEWIDEAAFEAHAEFPHMKRFLGLVGDPLRIRLRQSGRIKLDEYA